VVIFEVLRNENFEDIVLSLFTNAQILLLLLLLLLE
jgi:hypothetical protein